jgi:hypothetical protein
VSDISELVETTACIQLGNDNETSDATDIINIQTVLNLYCKFVPEKCPVNEIYKCYNTN